jgi:peptidoglycan/xylan/chitin deacetylase (PgdA/CDA1 family)
MASHLEHAAPILVEAGLRATFYINPSRGCDATSIRAELTDWSDLAATGHEIGNHSLTHPCSENVPGVERGLESMTLQEIEFDILEAERRLRIGTGNVPRTYCYPCYQDHVGRGQARRSYVPLVAQHFLAARGRGDHPNHPSYCDLHYLWSWNVERRSGSDMIALVERTVTSGRWGIFTFHGIEEGHLPVMEMDFCRLIHYLAERRDRILTAPVVDIAQRVHEWRKEKEHQ